MHCSFPVTTFPKLNDAQFSSLDDTLCLRFGQDCVSAFLTARPKIGIVAPLPSVPPSLCDWRHLLEASAKRDEGHRRSAGPITNQGPQTQCWLPPLWQWVKVLAGTVVNRAMLSCDKTMKERQSGKLLLSFLLKLYLFARDLWQDTDLSNCVCFHQTLLMSLTNLLSLLIMINCAD